MNAEQVNILIQAFLATTFLLILGLIIKYFNIGLKILLMKLKIINKEDERSYAEIIGFRIGKIVGKIFNK